MTVIVRPTSGGSPPDSWPMSSLLDLILPNVEPDGVWLEFGVAGGATLLELAKHAPIIYGFDSFQGLPTDWLDENGNRQEPKGMFACDPPQSLPGNCFLCVGMFEHMLPAFIRYWIYGPIRFVHIDCDLYDSTKFVLDQLHPYLDNVIIAFDEIRGFPAGEYHEGRAWNEFLAKGTYKAELLGHQHSAGAVYKLARN